MPSPTDPPYDEHFPYEPRLYWCDFVDGFLAEEVQAPDWDKVPEQKRAMVRQRFEASVAEKLKPTRWKPFGPQIPWYMRQPKYRVTVIGPAEQ